MKLSKQEREAIILDSRPIVKNVVRKYRINPDSVENLEQDGYRALCEAVDSYVEGSGYTLTSHIYYYVRKQVYLAHKKANLHCFDEFFEELHADDAPEEPETRCDENSMKKMIKCIEYLSKRNKNTIQGALRRWRDGKNGRDWNKALKQLRKLMGVL